MSAGAIVSSDAQLGEDPLTDGISFLVGRQTEALSLAVCQRPPSVPHMGLLNMTTCLLKNSKEEVFSWQDGLYLMKCHHRSDVLLPL